MDAAQHHCGYSPDADEVGNGGEDGNDNGDEVDDDGNDAGDDDVG